MTSSTSLSGTEFTCLAFMYVFCMSFSYLYANVEVLVNKANYRFNDKVYVLWFFEHVLFNFCLIEIVLFQVYNKVDQISIEEVDRLARRPNSVVIRSHFCVWCRCFLFLLCVCSISAVHFFW